MKPLLPLLISMCLVGTGSTGVAREPTGKDVDERNTPALWMSGQWGVRLPIYGGSLLSEKVTDRYGLDAYQGAVDQIVALKSVGYVFSSLNWNANGHLFTLADTAATQGIEDMGRINGWSRARINAERAKCPIDLVAMDHVRLDASAEKKARQRFAVRKYAVNGEGEIQGLLKDGREVLINEEEILINALKQIKASGKRVILYVNSGGFETRGGTANRSIARWLAYLEKKYGIYDQGQLAGYRNPETGRPVDGGRSTSQDTLDKVKASAYRLLITGFAQRLDEIPWEDERGNVHQRGLVDGYWLDHAKFLLGNGHRWNDGKNGDHTFTRDHARVNQAFVEALKKVNPKLVITVNEGDVYSRYKAPRGGGTVSESMADNKGKLAFAKVKAFLPSSPREDFTNGHPNGVRIFKTSSWAIEESVHRRLRRQAIVKLDGYEKNVVTHTFSPPRMGWGKAGEIVFTKEQAYRFVKTFTDAGGAFTWSTAVDVYRNPKGRGKALFVQPESYEIIKYVDDLMSRCPRPDYVPYRRPLDARFAHEYYTAHADYDGRPAIKRFDWTAAKEWENEGVDGAACPDANPVNGSVDVVVRRGCEVTIGKRTSITVDRLVVEDGAKVVVQAGASLTVRDNLAGAVEGGGTLNHRSISPPVRSSHE